MKAYFLLATFVLLCPAVQAQNLVVQTESEYTVAGMQHGGSLQYETASQWALGFFYQAEFEIADEAQQPGSAFLGARLQAPLAKTQRMSFFAILRGGLINDNFVALVPGLETRVHIGRRFGTAFGMSMRMGYASISGKLFVKMF